MKAILRSIRISPRKANLIAGIVRGKKVNEALSLLKFMPKKGAKILYKVVQSAASNAKNNFNQSFDDLYITRLIVTKGATYKRSIPISRGRAHPIRKRTCHITVEVGLKDADGNPMKMVPEVKEIAAKKPAKVVTKSEKATTKTIKKEEKTEASKPSKASAKKATKEKTPEKEAKPKAKK